MGVNVAGARVAQREVRVADVHDGKGVRHRRRGRPFPEVERRRRTKGLRGGKSGSAKEKEHSHALGMQVIAVSICSAMETGVEGNSGKTGKSSHALFHF